MLTYSNMKLYLSSTWALEFYFNSITFVYFKIFEYWTNLKIMDAFLTPLPSSRSDSAPSKKPSEEEQSSRPDTSSCQAENQCAQGNVPADSLPQIFQEIKGFFGPGKTNGKVKCTMCQKEITYSSKSNFNIKSHYDRQHKGEYTNLVAALSGASKRGRLPSGNW